MACGERLHLEGLDTILTRNTKHMSSDRLSSTVTGSRYLYPTIFCHLASPQPILHVLSPQPPFPSTQSQPRTPSCMHRRVQSPVYHMLPSHAEIYSLTAAGQVDCGFVAALYPSGQQRCPEGLHMYPCAFALCYLTFDLRFNHHISPCY
jgi:hypothetical protein